VSFDKRHERVIQPHERSIGQHELSSMQLYTRGVVINLLLWEWRFYFKNDSGYSNHAEVTNHTDFLSFPFCCMNVFIFYKVLFLQALHLKPTQKWISSGEGFVSIKVGYSKHGLRNRSKNETKRSDYLRTLTNKNLTTMKISNKYPALPFAIVELSFHVQRYKAKPHKDNLSGSLNTAVDWTKLLGS